MFLLSKAIVLSFRNFYLIFIYVLLISVPPQIFEVRSTFSKGFVVFLTLLWYPIILYISCVIDKTICQIINGEKVNFNNFRKYGAKYFVPYIKVSIGETLLAIPFFIPYGIYFQLHKNILTVEELGKTATGTIARLLPFAFFSIVTIYIMPFLFMGDILSMRVIPQGIKFFFKYFKKGLSTSVVVLFQHIILIIFSLATTQFSYSSNIYWYLTFAMRILDSYLTIIVFIMASLLYISLSNTT